MSEAMTRQRALRPAAVGEACSVGARAEGEAALPAAVAARSARRYEGGQVSDGVELLIEEVPVALVFNGISHAVMLATPADLEDFALGFALSEGIVAHAAEVRGIEVQAHAEGVEVALEISAERFAGLKQHRRTLAGRTGCGLCGVESLAALNPPITPVTAHTRVRPAAIVAALDTMRAHQRLHAQTGAAHAACWADLSGSVHSVREDVGRHNALDKLIGALARAGVDVHQGLVGVSSRASYEMVAKTARAGIATLAALSAPTAHAARLAAQLNMTLAAKARGNRFVVVAGADGILND